MEGKKSNKIREIVRLQQILKKWKKLATTNSSKSNNNNSNSDSNNGGGGGGNKGIKLLKKTLSFSDNNSSNSSYQNSQGWSWGNGIDQVPKGYLAVCVGKELRRYVIPTHYLGHTAFGILLREAEEEFGFQQEGVLKIPSDVAVFEQILRMVQQHPPGSTTSSQQQQQQQQQRQFFHHNAFFECHSQDMEVMSSTSLSVSASCSPDCTDHLLQSSHPQLCR